MKHSNHAKRLSGLILSPVLLLSACTNGKHPSGGDNFFAPPTLPGGSDDGRVSFKRRFGSNIQNGDALQQEHATLWSRLFDLYKLPDIDNTRVEQEVKWFLAHPDYLQRVQERAEPYLYSIVEEIENHDLPGEVALLPIVESAFRPYAYSRAHASGLWQFIPATGRHYGLRQDWWYDGRRDIHASTKAAVRYLKKLGSDFDGDWFLALAAYNYGEGNVARAIKTNVERQRPSDYWSLNLPRETQQYVPRLLAVSRILANAESLGIDLRPIPNQAATQVVDVGSQLDLNLAAELADISLDEFYRLNPGFNRSVTAPEGPHRLLLPVEKVQAFKRRLAALPADRRIGMRRHRVTAGESLSVVAEQYGVSVDDLRRHNRVAGEFLRVGEALLIPAGSAAVNAFAANQLPNSGRVAKPGAGDKRIHTVKKGDTLFGIARRHGVNIRQLAAWNNMKTGDVLKAGHQLVIHPGGKPTTVASAKIAGSSSYTVRRGDSLFDISRRFNVTVGDLRKWNGVGTLIRPGQVIKISDSSS